MCPIQRQQDWLICEGDVYPVEEMHLDLKVENCMERQGGRTHVRTHINKCISSLTLYILLFSEMVYQKPPDHSTVTSL